MRLLCGLLTTLVVASTGCSRWFWNAQADRDAYSATLEHIDDPRWDVPRLEVEAHPLSRNAELGAPVQPPLPPDDPAANQYMRRLNGINGYKSWHKLGQAFSIENPDWVASLGLVTGEDGEVVAANPSLGRGLRELSLPDALELATLHNRDYQDEIENVLLTSLALTLQRFQFDVRYLGLGGSEPSTDFESRNVPGGVDTGLLTSRAGVRRFLPSGGQIAVELVNNTLWLFSAPGGAQSVSVLSYSLTQPLLFAAGRKVVLEALTQAERNVLYAVRDLARFRRIFFSQIVAGGNGFLGLILQRQLVLNRAGNVERLENQLDRLQTLNSPRPRVTERTYGLPPGLTVDDFPESLTGPITETSGRLLYNADRQELTWVGEITDEQREAMLSLVEASEDDPAEVLIEQWFGESIAGDFGGASTRIAAISRATRRARADYFRRAVREILSRLGTEAENLAITQLRTQLANARLGVRQAEVRYQDSLDQFKILLGLPTDLPVSVEETLLEPFQLIDPTLTELEAAFDDFAPVVFSIEDENPTVERLREVADGLSELQQRLVEEGFAIVENDFARTERLLDEEDDDDETSLPSAGDNRGDARTRGTADDDSVLGSDRTIDSDEERRRVSKDLRNDRKLFQSLRSEYEAEFYYDLTAVESRLARVQRLAASDTLTADQILSLRSELADLREVMLRLVRNLQVVQTDLRVELLPLRPFRIPEQATIGYALANRLDLMNRRAAVMDARRAVEVAANALRSTLNLRATGDVRASASSNPFDFRGRLSQFRFGINFVAPLDRVQQRNTYRAALVAYNRARRDYIAFEDQVKFEVRTAFRQLEVLRTNFETARIAVRAAARQYDNAVEQSSQAGNAQGLNLLQALAALLNAQDNLIQIFVSYEQNRIAIYRDMGVMRIDPQGVWIDTFYQRLAEQDARGEFQQSFVPEPTVLPPLPEGIGPEGWTESPLVIDPDFAHNLINEDVSVPGPWLPTPALPVDSQHLLPIPTETGTESEPDALLRGSTPGEDTTTGDASPSPSPLKPVSPVDHTVPRESHSRQDVVIFAEGVADVVGPTPDDMESATPPPSSPPLPSAVVRHELPPPDARRPADTASVPTSARHSHAGRERDGRIESRVGVRPAGGLFDGHDRASRVADNRRTLGKSEGIITGGAHRSSHRLDPRRPRRRVLGSAKAPR